jgi:sigma-E factor negative regulatory protein RseA
MNKEQSSLASALYDGELESCEVVTAIRESLDDGEHWRIYAHISDGLRGENIHAPDMTASVMARLREEPVVLAPRNLQPKPRQHPLFALAASVAGVAVVGWLAFGGIAGTPATVGVAAVVPASKERLVSAVAPAPSLSSVQQGRNEAELNEYLLAHHAQAASVRMGESAKQIRTVAMTAVRP